MTIASAVVSKEYNLIGILEDDLDVINSFSEYDGSTYICDAISEIADRFIPIYNHDVWKDASNIQEYIEEAVESGLAYVEGNEVDLIKIFQAGYYQYYTQLLYDNLDAMAFNYIADKVEEAYNNLNQETKDEVDLGYIADDIASETENTDNNDMFSDLDDKANEIISRMNEGNYAL